MRSRAVLLLLRQFLLVVGGLTAALPASAEESRWYQIGVGTLATSDYSAPVLELGLNYQSESDFYAARLSEVPGLGMFLPCAWSGYSDCENRRGVGALALLYGQPGPGVLRSGLFAAGLGAVWGNDLHSAAKARDRFVTVGVALETQVIFRPASWFKLGVAAELNINPSVSFGALSLFVPFGGV